MKIMLAGALSLSGVAVYSLYWYQELYLVYIQI